jgi:polar amino acid transport system substrate-binding protein
LPLWPCWPRAGSDDDDDRNGGGTDAASTEQADACSKDRLAVKNAGQLTVGTDNPAFPPYFVDDDPTNAKASRAPWPTRSRPPAP